MKQFFCICFWATSPSCSGDNTKFGMWGMQPGWAKYKASGPTCCTITPAPKLVSEDSFYTDPQERPQDRLKRKKNSLMCSKVQLR